MDSMVISVSIAADEFLRMYQGQAKFVWARSFDGRSIKFPAHYLRPFVTRDGVHGTFRLSFDQQHKLTGIERV